MTKNHYKVAIIGGGVTGTALAYILSRFTNVEDIILIEKNRWVAEINSHPLNNAQTSHDGSTETNYPLDHALEVQKSATALRRYVDSKGDETLSRKVRRMVLAVTASEVEKLKKRYAEFKPHYPDLWIEDWHALANIEPNVMKGRSPYKTPPLAMGSNEGYIVNYQRLAEHILPADFSFLPKDCLYVL